MFSGSSYMDSGLADLREKQKSASKQYRDKQKLLQQERTMEFEQIKDANYRLAAENNLLKSEITEKFGILAAGMTQLTAEVRQLSSILKGEKLTPAALSFTQDATSDGQPSRQVVRTEVKQENQWPANVSQVQVPSEQPIFSYLEEEDPADYTAALSNHGFLFVLVLLVIFVLPKFLLPTSATAPRMAGSGLHLIQLGSIRKESNLESFQTGFVRLDNADPDANAVRLAGGFPTLDLDQFCRTACKGQIE